MGFKKRLSHADIERFRNTNIRIDRNGEIWHEGKIVEHHRLKMALLSWLDVLPDGRSIIRLDDKRFGYVKVDDAHLLATSLGWNPRGEAVTLLNNGQSHVLNLKTLRVGRGHAIYATVGKLVVRLLTPAYYALAERIKETSQRFEVHTQNKRYLIRMD